MALPGGFLLIQMASVRSNPSHDISDLLLMALYYVIAPGVIFGALGSAALAFLASPTSKLRTVVLGIVTGLLCPVLLFGALIIFLPRNEGALGWFLFGFIFAMTGAFAGFMAGNSLV